MNLETKIIIPAAGFGTRMGHVSSKEILPLYKNEPIINFAVGVALKFKMRAHVITRPEKVELIHYLKQFNHVDIQLIEPSKEWPDTILQSREFWAPKNILLLPDTYWGPETIIDTIFDSLIHYQIAVGFFSPSDLKTWGIFNKDAKNYTLCEKPNFTLNPNCFAWGLLGFRREVGEELFKKILESTFDHEWKQTNFTFDAHPIEYFMDPTR